jgi:hypothetical protein
LLWPPLLEAERPSIRVEKFIRKVKLQRRAVPMKTAASTGRRPSQGWVP